MADDAESLVPRKVFLPSTFEDRGTLVPFTTPLLQGSRIRKDERHLIVLLVPSFSGGPGCYIVPWKSVPDLASMTIHDRALSEDISANDAVTPTAVREAWLRVSTSGLSGPEVKVFAEQASAEDAAAQSLTHDAVLARLCSGIGLDMADPRLADSKEAARLASAACATRLGVTQQVVEQRLEGISTSYAALGMLGQQPDGRLRRLLGAIAELGRTVEAMAPEAAPEAAALYDFTATVAQLTLEIADRLVIQLDAAAVNMPRLVAQWETDKNSVVWLTDRLSWLLDGWDQAIGAWKATPRTARDQAQQLPYFVRTLPLIPRKEVGVNSPDAQQRLEQMYKSRPIRGLENWRTGEINAELTRRLESTGGKALAATLAAKA